ncbi:D-xylose transporter-like [Periplaneta americana]|uniref:D-xylose transporter-like n=1 Tax=Periplaneta americana TaxID=6978 RepID=UPI0037E7289F
MTAQCAGWGLYHRGVVAICSLCLVADAGAMMNLCFSIPLAVCTFRATDSKILMHNMVSWAGAAAGGLVFGYFTDAVGRKRIIMVILVFEFIGLIGSSFAPTESMFALSIIVLGMGTSSSTTTTKIYIAEVVPKNKRGSKLVLLDVCWSVGYLLATVFFSGFVPIIFRELADVRSKLKFYTWRMLFGLVGTVTILVSCATSLLGSSPRFLLAMRKVQEAGEVLRLMFALNKSEHAKNYQVRMGMH